MKFGLLAISAAAIALASGGAVGAQQAGSHNPAVKDSHPHAMAAPAKGRNSFTEGQARKRLAKAGYTGVGALTKDANGVWMGTAMKGGQQANIGLDYKGNITVR